MKYVMTSAVVSMVALAACENAPPRTVTDVPTRAAPASSTLLGETIVDGISARVYDMPTMRIVELDALFTNNAQWNARFTNAGLRAAERVAGCPATQLSGTGRDMMTLDQSPFIVVVTQNC